MPVTSGGINGNAVIGVEEDHPKFSGEKNDGAGEVKEIFGRKERAGEICSA